MHITLTVMNGPNADRSFSPPGSQPYLIGRGSKSDFSVIDLRMSREHFQLIGNEVGWCVRDLGSHHGTWVNGEQVRERVLQDGDLIVAGDTTFRVSLADRPTRRQDSAQAPQSNQELANRRTWTERLK